MRKTASWICLIFALGAFGAVPEIALKQNIIGDWHDFAEGRRTVESLVVPQFGTTPALRSGKNAVVLPVNFSGTAFERACWDLPVKIDMGRSKGVSFDFFCDDLSCFSGFSFYLRADGRWLQAHFCPDQEGQWCGIRILKSAFKEDDPNSKVRGCLNVDRIRISGWRMKDVDTRCAIANVAVIPVVPDVLVIHGVSSAGEGEPDSDYVRFAENLEKTLAKLDVECVGVSDRELSRDLLQEAQIAAVAYSTSLPQSVMPLLSEFVANGGKVMAFYAAPGGLRELLGVRQGQWIKDERGTFSGFARSDGAVPYQPEFAPQPSWNANVFTPDPARAAGRVAAVWRDGGGADTEHPAIVVTDTGAMFGHVWLADPDPRAADLLMSVIGSLAPALWEKRARKAIERIGRFDDTADFQAFRDLFEKQSPAAEGRRLFEAAVAARESALKLLAAERWPESCAAAREAADLAERCRCTLFSPAAGEHRAFWCHSAFGLKERDWDESVGFLKRHGFNVIIPNMSWGTTAYYRSQVLPVHASVAERGDQIELCLAACRKHGVKCHIWRVNWNTGGRMSAELAAEFRAAGRIQVSDSGDDSQLWLCPSHPENQRLEIDSQLEVARNYAVDGVHFDYIRYPGHNYCFCGGCRARFEALIGTAVKVWPRDAMRGGEHFQKYLEFRRENITRVVREVAQRARQIRPGVQISAAVFRNALSDRDSIGQDWQLWCERGWLDFVCPMNYIDSTRAFQSVILMQKSLVGKVPLYPGIGLSCWTDGSSYPLKLSRQITAVRAAGLKGFTVFNFDASAEHALPYVSLGVTRE